MSREVEEPNSRMLRARDAMDRSYADPLDIAALARIAHVSARSATSWGSSSAARLAADAHR